MRYLASEKLEIIRLVEQSHLGVKRTLAKIGVSRSTFYRWYDLYRRFGEPGLEDRRAGPKRPAWNRIPDEVRSEIIEMALERPELSPRELAVTVRLRGFRGRQEREVHVTRGASLRIRCSFSLHAEFRPALRPCRDRYFITHRFLRPCSGRKITRLAGRRLGKSVLGR